MVPRRESVVRRLSVTRRVLYERFHCSHSNIAIGRHLADRSEKQDCQTVYRMTLFRLIIVFLVCTGVKMALAEHNLTIMLITSFGEFGFDSSGAIPAADVALDDINSMLPGYRLVYDKPRNSQVSKKILSHRASTIQTKAVAMHDNVTCYMLQCMQKPG